MKTAFYFGILAASLFAVSLTACKKDKSTAPLIVISEPDNGASIALSDSLHIEGTLSDDESLHEASVIIKSMAGDTVFSAYPYVHDLKTYNFHYHFHPMNAGMYHLHVNVEDHDENLTTAERSFTVTP